MKNPVNVAQNFQCKRLERSVGSSDNDTVILTVLYDNQAIECGLLSQTEPCSAHSIRYSIFDIGPSDHYHTRIWRQEKGRWQ